MTCRAGFKKVNHWPEEYSMLRWSQDFHPKLIKELGHFERIGDGNTQLLPSRRD
jgi:hypothetical protein